MSLECKVSTKPLCDFLIPTFNNVRQCAQCVDSIINHTYPRLYRVLVANNGEAGSLDPVIVKGERLKVFEMGGNRGWEGGLRSLLPHTESDILCLMNDDTFVPPNDPVWLMKILSEFRDPKVGAVGPSSNVVMGKQNMFYPGLPRKFNTSLLIGFCLFVRREALEQCGGISDGLPGGDDLDLSMRLEKAGWSLRVRRDVFIFHHGFQTGHRVFGNYWNSQNQQDQTNIELIRRNGFARFWRCKLDVVEEEAVPGRNGLTSDAEGDLIREFVPRDGRWRVADLGCGSKKTVDFAVGVDLFPKGVLIPSLNLTGDANTSQADVVSEVSSLPFQDQEFDAVIARHILEHLIDPVKAIREWARVCRKRLIIALPDEDISPTIPMNPEHVHAYTKTSFTRLVETLLPEFKIVCLRDAGNGVAFVGVMDRQ